MKRDARIVLTVGAIGLAGATSAAADPLDAYRGTHRVLVLSAPDPADRHLVVQREALASVRPALAERDLVVVEVFGDDRDAVVIRKRLALPRDVFRAILIGKDGGAKITSDEPISQQRLFSTVDAMPMRRDEMRRGR